MAQHDEPHAKRDAQQEAALKDTFPASDPPSTTPPPGTRLAEQLQGQAGAAGEATAKGTPDSGRHASETAHADNLHDAHTKA